MNLFNNMDFFTLILYALAGFVVIYFLLYVLTAQNILGVVLKKTYARIIPRSEVPGYLTKFYEIEESQLLDLGFSYQYCLLTEDTVIKEYSQRYIFVYCNPQEKTYANLTASDAADYRMPFKVSFETHFKSGKKLLTFNGLKHAIIGTIPHSILVDAYAETLEKHFRFHLQHLAGAAAREGEIKEFDPAFTEEMLVKRYDRDSEEYLNQLEQKGITYKVGEDKYGIKTLAALGITHQMISGLNKINALRKKILAQKAGSLGAADVPVELEIANYQNTREVLNQPIKNTTGKIIFLLLSLLLFAGAFSLLLSFDFVVLLAAVVFLHESGHLLAMRLLGYKNLKMLFIPLFGAVAMGSDKGVSPYKKVIGYFAGPVPGIILGFLLLFKIQQGGGLVPSWQSPTLLTAALMLLGLNYFNLLPVLPFDGGQVLNTIIFSRFAFMQIFFYLVSLLAILALAVVLETPLLFFVALLVGFGVFQSFTQRRIINTVKQELKTAGPVPGTEVLKKTFQVLRQAPYNLYSFKKKFQVVQNLESVLNTPKASMVTVMVTLVFYLFLIGAPVVYIFGPLWKMKYGGGLHYPAGYRNPCEAVIKYKPGPGSLTPVNPSDFKRLDAKPLGSDCPGILRYCFCYPGIFNASAGPGGSTPAPQTDSRDKQAEAVARANATHPGTFLAKLWALYGKPDEEPNGFSYTLSDQKTGIIFRAFLDQGAPMYASPEKDERKIIPLFYRFEALLEDTAPVDCYYVYKSDPVGFEIGVMNGKPYYDMLSSLDKENLIKNAVVFPAPVSINLQDLYRMLWVYKAMFAIGHDRWLTSESTMTRVTIEITGLPEGLTKDRQLELFPALKKALGDKKEGIFFKELNRPRAAFMESGVYPDPANNRLLLLQGSYYTQDETLLAKYLNGVDQRVLVGRPGVTADMEFLPGDTEDPGDLEKYYLYIKGQLTPGSTGNTGNPGDPGSPVHLEITGTVGPVNTLEKMKAWIEAAKFFARFEKVGGSEEDYRFEAEDESEARQVKELCRSVSENLQNIAVDGKTLTGKNGAAELLGLVVTYHRYGRKVMGL